MKFNSSAGQELRTWILFFVGIALAIVFAFQKNPLNPWWTLIIGAFTCTAIIVSAVQAITGGKSDDTLKTISKVRGDEPRMDSETPTKPSLSIAMGPFGSRPFWVVRSCNAATV